MAVNQLILEAIEEMVHPDEMALANEVEDSIELEQDALLSAGDDEDQLVEFIDNGGRIGYENPIDFSDEVEDALADEIED